MSEGTETDGRHYWDARYSESERIWSGEPNAALVDETSGIEPGTALDLGCGEGADAVWLARRGWRVVAVDISAVALERARGHAAEAGVAGRIDFQRRDLGTSFPEGDYDLVAALFLHSWTDLPRERILRTAASRVAPSGTLLIVGHVGEPVWVEDLEAYVPLPTSAEVLQSLEPDDRAWEVLLSRERERAHASPGGHHADSIVKLRRR